MSRQDSVGALGVVLPHLLGCWAWGPYAPDLCKKWAWTQWAIQQHLQSKHSFSDAEAKEAAAEAWSLLGTFRRGRKLDRRIWKNPLWSEGCSAFFANLIFIGILRHFGDSSLLEAFARRRVQIFWAPIPPAPCMSEPASLPRDY